MPRRFDLATPFGRFKAWVAYMVMDFGLLRLALTNAHWVDPDLVRANQPSPGQLAYWKRRGVRTVINLRGARPKAYYALEVEACRRLGLTLIDAPLDSRDAPTADRVKRARDLFASVEYPVLIHCKSGADRVGLMAVFYRHFHKGEPVSTAIAELGKRTLHHREGLTGVLDHMLEAYVAEGEPAGLDLVQWVERPQYDIRAIRAEFKASWWGTLLTEKLLRRE